MREEMTKSEMVTFLEHAVEGTLELPPFEPDLPDVRVFVCGKYIREFIIDAAQGEGVIVIDGSNIGIFGHNASIGFECIADHFDSPHCDISELANEWNVSYTKLTLAIDQIYYAFNYVLVAFPETWDSISVQQHGTTFDLEFTIY